MNNLVLVRVARALDAGFAGDVLRDVRQDDAHRFRFLFEPRDGAGASFIVSLRPELPWIGRPRGRWPGLVRVKEPFAGTCSRALRGTILDRIRKDPADRIVRLLFADGCCVVVELATHGANLVLLDPRGRIQATARNPRSARQRLGVGEIYAPPARPARLLDPFGCDAAAVDALIRAHQAKGEATGDILRRHFFGLGAEAAGLVLRESHGAESAGETLIRRLSEISAGQADPVIEAPSDPLRAAENGTLERSSCRLLPWRPAEAPRSPAQHLVAGDAAGTAGLYHEALERLGLTEERWTGIRGLMERELRKLSLAGQKASRDLEDFADPDSYRVFGEALLAGLARARVEGTFAIVPDPYNPPGADGAAAEIAVPVPPGLSLTAAARAHFDKHRRAQRGRERARRRVDALVKRRRSLAAILDHYKSATGLEALLAMENALREQGFPVALEPASRAGRALHRSSRPRLEGVRVLTGRTGVIILVGRGGRENDRLTFRLSSPEDLWFHALGCPGAHVVVRWSSESLAVGGDPKRPPPEVIAEAAAVAAWYSDARTEMYADVQWTRRKYVRRRRGAAPGTVILKKFQTVRVRPALPEAVPGSP